MLRTKYGLAAGSGLDINRYPSRTGVKKSDFYRTLAPYTPSGALPAVFSSRDEEVHKGLRGPIAPLNSMSRVLPLEGFVDRTMDVLVRQIDERFTREGGTLDLASWLQFFAFDVMGTLTFSKRYGFLEKGTDGHGMLDAIWRFLKGAAPFTQIPWVDEIWNKNVLATRLEGAIGVSILVSAVASMEGMLAPQTVRMPSCRS
ncbi:hypothetical protein BDW68DRAFT_176527 [Aspergillus falconensis]